MCPYSIHFTHNVNARHQQSKNIRGVPFYLLGFLFHKNPWIISYFTNYKFSAFNFYVSVTGHVHDFAALLLLKEQPGTHCIKFWLSPSLTCPLKFVTTVPQYVPNSFVHNQLKRNGLITISPCNRSCG